MDFLRSSIKVLFHDIAPSDIMDIIDNRLDDRDFFDRIGELLTHRESTFSGRELEGLWSVLYREWLGDVKDMPSFQRGLYSCPERIFSILAKFGEETLNLHDAYPRVKFPHLLRWTDLSRYVEENILTIPYLTIENIRVTYSHRGFCWPNVLGHDNGDINDLLNSGLSDIHSHLYASTDIFEFNWLTAMNHPETISVVCEALQSQGKGVDFLKAGRRLMYDGVSRFSRYHYSLADWMMIAAYLRIHIYENLIGEIDSSWDFSTGVLMDVPDKAYDVIHEVRAVRSLLIASGKALMTSNGLFLDYLISKETGSNLVNEHELTSPYMIHHGERWMLHEFLTRYFGTDDRKLRESAPYLWLYLLIRSKVRREFVQVNGLVGFDNFQRYQRRKTYFISARHSERLNETALRYAVQSALAEYPNDHLEGRISSGQARTIVRMKLRKSIFGDKDILSEEDIRRLTFVIHFLKRRPTFPIIDGSSRYSALSKEYDKDMRRILEHRRWQVRSIDRGSMSLSVPRFVGIDAASSELACRPEVFAEYYVRANQEGIHNFTFHAGEDFFDILDGMRTIDETVRFFGFFRGCRIGHGLALATDSYRYYEDRHYTMILPAQELLDNLVWMKSKADRLDVSLHRSTVEFIRSNVAKLLNSLHYNRRTPEDYCEALWHRCDKEDSLQKLTKEVRDIIDDYYCCSEVINAGYETKVLTKLPPHWSEDIANLQEAILSEFESKGIVVECTPTSNLRIGRFEKYSDHPVFRFHGVKYHRKHTIPATINTDDCGVFATSLRNEYSLIAAALYKEKDENGLRRYSDREIEEYIASLMRYGNRSRFRI